MSIQMRGAEVAKAMKEKLIREREELNAAGVNPCLTIIRVGAKENDLAYERGAKKRMEMIGIECRIVELPEDISQEEFEEWQRFTSQNMEMEWFEGNHFYFKDEPKRVVDYFCQKMQTES